MTADVLEPHGDDLRARQLFSKVQGTADANSTNHTPAGGERFCGAAAANRNLAVITIERVGETWAIDRYRSFTMNLEGRDRRALLNFRLAVDKAFFDRQIASCTMRAAQDHGPYMTAGLTLKVEAALQFSETAIVNVASWSTVKACEEVAGVLLAGSSRLGFRLPGKLTLFATAAAISAACQENSLSIEMLEVGSR